MANCLSIADVIANQMTFLSETGDAIEVSYYSATLTGHNNTTSVRSPSEDTSVSVTGTFGKVTRKDESGTLTTRMTFAFPSDGSLVPKPMDRFTATRDGELLNYTVTSVVKLGSGATSSGFELTVEEA